MKANVAALRPDLSGWWARLTGLFGRGGEGGESLPNPRLDQGG